MLPNDYSVWYEHMKRREPGDITRMVLDKDILGNRPSDGSTEIGKYMA